MCWLTSCSPETKERAEFLLTIPGLNLNPTGVVMRDPATGQMVIVEQGRVATLELPSAERLFLPPKD